MKRREFLRSGLAVPLAGAVSAATLPTEERTPEAVREKMLAVIGREPLVRLEYLEIVDPVNLEAMRKIDGPTVIAVAAHVGKTRLIDNILIGMKRKKTRS